MDGSDEEWEPEEDPLSDSPETPPITRKEFIAAEARRGAAASASVSIKAVRARVNLLFMGNPSFRDWRDRGG
jgi:hypothetical protein